jgi:hypothetical protein
MISANDYWIQQIELLRKHLKEMERQADLTYDCLMQVITEKLGEREAHRLHLEARERCEHIQSRTETATQPPRAKAEGKNQLYKQDYWTDN